jgi:Ankyrin repeats (many copies)/Ankyrin repeat
MYRFRWVFCQLETLRRSSPPAIRGVLAELPRSLDETYERTLLGIEQEQRDYTHRLLQCLTVAARPLCVEELAEVLAIRFVPGQLPEYHADWRSEDPREDVLRACSNLIHVVNVDGSPVVQFSHFSVKEFLTSDRLAIAPEELSRYHILPNSAHTILAQACLSVLLHFDDHVDKRMMENFPFALYAAQHWADHARFGDVASRIGGQMECLFDKNRPHFRIWVWLHDIDLPFQESMFGSHPVVPVALPLYYATLCGLDSLVEHLVDAHPGDVNMRGGLYLTPLHAAVVKRYIGIAQLLLEHAADPNALDHEPKSALHMACGTARCDMVDLLLRHHADVDIRGNHGMTSLYVAASDGELEVTRILLRHNSAVDSRDDSGRTPLGARRLKIRAFGDCSIVVAMWSSRGLSQR